MSGTEILIWHGKHGTFQYAPGEDGTLDDAAIRLLKEIHSMDWYYGEDEAQVEEILLSGDGQAAMKFLKRRSAEGYEYESIEIGHLA